MKLSKFGENLNNIMKSGKITQAVLAKELNTTQQTISRWLQGINEPDFDTLIKICLMFDLSPEYMLGIDEINKELKQKYEFRIKKWDGFEANGDPNQIQKWEKNYNKEFNKKFKK